VPLVVFSAERNSYLPDVPSVVEAGYDVPVAQFRAIAAPAGTPEEVVERLREAFQAAFENADYQAFNEEKLLTPHEISGEQVVEEWTEARDGYAELVAEYGIDMGSTS
jgi:tripartite-type tricarboxylate transporter receptor subunit TctC